MDSKKTKIDNCIILKFKEIFNIQGNLIPIEQIKDVPFEIKRVYFLYRITENSKRGGHAHKALYQVILSLNGSFDVLLDDGFTKKIVHLSNPNEGLLIVPGIWRELFSFSNNSICLVLASELYDEHDYIRNYDEFIKFKALENK